MTYPSTPWHLKGKALMNLHWVSLEESCLVIPPELTIIPILPGKTIGGVYLASYQAGSILEYNELIVVPALVRYHQHIGFWISHIYVDNEDSMRGGREIWGLPKEIADFKWTNSEVLVTQQKRSLCHFSFQSEWLNLMNGWQPKLQGICLSRLENQLLSFNSHFQTKFSLIKGKLNITQESPFFSLNLAQGFLSFSLDDLELKINAPRQIHDFSIL
ncbi:acetoacetate decarboxylase [Aphanothece hegewaldii CCALA 016]|uniref:Acetoacetate decarboxylase n=1 Tax=Aphanothece hegewaldii CCALA 016 TaxID=2107694 RepID=A0A2T1LUZ6_9CHRO|nr:acetoacetate decarboxylase family protein [Aphanothece hegewaldii]PSF35452.1 acetoacetate decarboxylase [Aphanothece hegewaldii CCALA 016]